MDCAGSIPRPLDSNVERGAANVASMRRLRHMSRGAMALETSTSQGRTKEDTAKDFKRHLKLEKENADRSRGHRSVMSALGASSCCAQGLEPGLQHASAGLVAFG